MRMKSEEAGKDFSLEVTNISNHGFWVYRNGEEYFLSYEDFPWFKEAKVNEILNIMEESPEHLYWPDIDVDLSLSIIRSPEKYPLIYKKDCQPLKKN